MWKEISSKLRDFLGDTHEVSESIREALEERLTSPFYGYFLISWLIINWDYVYAAFFIDGELIYEEKNLLKNDYMLQLILPAQYEWLYWWNFLILPFLVTLAAFWFMPYVTRFFFRKHIKNKIRNEQIRAQELEAEIKAETKVLEAEVEQAKVREEAEKTSPELLWRKEFEDFKKTTLYSNFEQLIEHFYQHDGSISFMPPFGTSNQVIDKNMLVFADVQGLIKISGNNFTFTEKGKAFVRFYTNEHVG